MAATGTVNITGTVTDLPSGSKTLGPIVTTSDAALDSSLQLELASGANTIDVPDGATSVIVVFDAASAVDKTLKGVTGDTGIKLGQTGSFKFDVDPTLTEFCITASAADTDCITTVIFV